MAAAEVAAVAEAEAAAAASAALGPRALAAATTVWLAFEGITPPEEIQEIVSGNRGIWMPTAEVESDGFQKAKLQVQRTVLRTARPEDRSWHCRLLGPLGTLVLPKALANLPRTCRRPGRAQPVIGCSRWPGSDFRGSP